MAQSLYLEFPQVAMYASRSEAPHGRTGSAKHSSAPGLKIWGKDAHGGPNNSSCQSSLSEE